MYKIIAVDADGTLLDRESRIPEENKAALIKAQKAGVHVALCSGRSIVTLARFADELGLDPENSHIISFNGGAVFDGMKQQIHDVRMDRRTFSYILENVARFGITTCVYDQTDHMFVNLFGGDRLNYDYYYRNSLVETVFTEDFLADIGYDVYKLLLIGDTEKLRDVELFMSENAAEIPYGMFFSSARLLEFMDVRSTKAEGLDFVCRRLGIDMRREAIAIGDSFNDLSMIKEAALGVCMKNGDETVKLAAKYITERDNYGCGVAEVINRFVFAN